MLRKMTVCVLTLWLTMGIAMTAHAQDDSLWQITSEDLREIIGSAYTYGAATLSPSGDYVAWLEVVEGLCVYDFAANTLNCHPLPWDQTMLDNMGLFGSDAEITWSPDENTIAFHEPMTTGDDTDLWLFARDSATFTNLTDDQAIYFGDSPDLDLDYAPLWNLEGDHLYFVRVEFSASEERTSGLYRIAASGGEPALVSELPAVQVVYDAVLSPDGTHIAALLQDHAEGYANDGLWLIDVSDGTRERIAAAEMFLAGMPEWVSTLRFDDLVWRGTNVIVGVYGGNGDDAVMQNYHHVDMATGEVTPLTDMSALTADDLEDNAAEMMPRAGILSADGETFFYVHYAENQHEVMLSSISLDDYTTQVEDVTMDFIPYGTSLYETSDNGRALVNQRTLLTFERG